MTDEKDHSIVWIIDDFLTMLRDSRLVAPCEECGYPVPTPITFGGEHLCSYHAPQPELDDAAHPIEMEEQEDG